MNKFILMCVYYAAGFFTMVAIVELSEMGDRQRIAVSELAKCEKSLPRDMSCEIVIRAKVKEQQK